MTEPTPPPKPRWRPRFSLRTLMLGVLLIALMWSATSVWGVPSIQRDVDQWEEENGFKSTVTKIAAIAPFLIECEIRTPNYINNGTISSRTWFWFFGYTYHEGYPPPGYTFEKIPKP